MKVLILGSTGMLGSSVFNYLKNKRYDLYTTYRNENLKYNSNSFYFNPLTDNLNILKNFDFILNCIGIIKPFVNEKTAEETISINSLFPRKLANFCELNKIKLIHITTDCVFSGKDGLYDENSKHDCLDLYGKSKSIGEPDNCMVLRTSIIGDEIHKNASLIAWVKSNANKEINGYTNHLWNGITTVQYGQVCEAIIENDLFCHDLFHIYSNDISKYSLVNLINKYYNLNIKINKIVTDESIDRTLRTVKNLNSILKIPSIEEQIKIISKGDIK